MKRMLILSFIIYLLCSCAGQRNITLTDFYFSIDDGYKEYYSHKQKKFYRQYEYNLKSFEIKLTESEVREI